MTDKGAGEHLSPELFVDLLEGAPIEASRRQHFERCPACRDELGGLEQTLAFVKAEDAAGSPVAPRARSWRPSASVRIALAAAVVAAVWLSVDAIAPRFVPAPSALRSDLDEDSILPPVEEDDEFQVLLALAASYEPDPSTEDELGLGAGSLLVEPFMDLGLDQELDPEERLRLLEELAESLRWASEGA